MFELSLDEMSEDDWDRMMAVNMRAPVFLAKALLPQLRKRGGSIVNIGSIEGLGANPWHAAYCGSKAGVHGFTRALAVDLGRDGIRCNAIAPGWINSDLSHAYIDAQPDPAQARAGLLKLHPVGRTGEPQDIGSVVVFLASDPAAFITGQVIVVDGGRTAKLPLPF
ncbi:3-oxoacyl-[acyl-carrier-protein] reductase FabG [compost metagenome]